MKLIRHCYLVLPSVDIGVELRLEKGTDIGSDNNNTDVDVLVFL